MKQTDQHIIKLCLSGNVAAQRTLYERYRRNWYMLSLRYGKSSYEADDILQEGLIGIFKNLNQFDPNRGKFITWSSRVLVNAALRYLKKNSWQNTFTDVEDQKNVSSDDHSIYSEMAAKELTELLQHLPMGYRIVFNMYAIEGYSHKEISESLNITVGTSKSQLSKARKSLRAIVETQLMDNS